jgi:tetratricopeptide (TPR) repeat protein
MPNDLSRLSPSQTANLYYNACRDGDIELLRNIIYFPPDATERQIEQEIESRNLKNDHESSTILVGMMGLRMKAKYEKMADNDTAEVGMISKAGALQCLFAGKPSYIFKAIPSEQIILKRDGGIWKYYHNKNNFNDTSELVTAIKNNPEDASLYYYYGMLEISENPYRAHRCFKQYYELEPDGFWITEEFIAQLKDYEDLSGFEKMMLNYDTPPGNMSTVYIKLGLAFAECGDYLKAKQYYEKADEALTAFPSIDIESLKKAKHELQLRIEGKYIDILDAK